MTETIEQEIARNRAVRAANIERARRLSRREGSALFRAARWAAVPLREGYALWREHVRHAPARRRVIADYLAGDGFKGLQVGCGPFRIEGWLNTDLMPRRMPWRAPDTCETTWDFPLDITAPLPFPDASLDAIFGEEVIEHVPREAALAFMAEARRVLRPDGVLRLTTPDIEGVCRLFLGEAEGADIETLEPYWLEGEWSPEHWINGQFRFWGHQFLWSGRQLTAALRDAGFARAERVTRGTTASRHERLAGVAGRTGPRDEAAAIARHTALVVEGLT